MSKVTVKADSKGQVAYPGKKGITSIRVVQTRFNKGGFEIELSGFLKVKDANVGNYPAGTKIDGKIIILETLAPAYEGHEAKRAGAEGAFITSGGQKVYRQTLYTSDLEAADTLQASDAVTVSAEMEA